MKNASESICSKNPNTNCMFKAYFKYGPFMR